MKRYYLISILVGLVVAGVALAAPYYRQEASLVPIDSSENIGTSTNRWAEGHFVQVCISGDCQTAWPSGGSSFSTTSADWWKENRNFFSTTSADHWDGLKNRFGTTSISASAPLTWNTGTAALSISQSGSAMDGYLSSAHWTIFNNKISSTSLSATSPLSYNSGTGVFTIDTSGTWSGNAGTATALAANGANCSAGNAPLGVDASGAVESCFDVWTEAENTTAAYAPQSRQLTVAGTANQITSSAGAQTLAADRTWTLSLPNHVIFPSSYQAAQGTTTNATSTNLTVRGNLIAEGLTSALTIAGTGGLFAEYTGTSCGAGQFANALSALGVATCGTPAGSDFPFTTTTFGATTANATSTLMGFTNGLYALASSTIGNGTAKGGLTIAGNATSTGFKTKGGFVALKKDVFSTTTVGTNAQVVFTGARDTDCTFSAAVLTCPSNVAYFEVEIWGGGGGGAGGGTGALSYNGGGGQGGSYSYVLVGATTTTTFYYTVGAGGAGGADGATGGSSGSTGSQSCFGFNSTACTSPLAQANGGSGGPGSGGQGSASTGGTAGDITIAGGVGGGTFNYPDGGNSPYAGGSSGGAGARGGAGGPGGGTGYGVGNPSGYGVAATGLGGGGGGGGNKNAGGSLGGAGAAGGFLITVWTY